jgi:hypothetical protein
MNLTLGQSEAILRAHIRPRVKKQPDSTAGE